MIVIVVISRFGSGAHVIAGLARRHGAADRDRARSQDKHGVTINILIVEIAMTVLALMPENIFSVAMTRFACPRLTKCLPVFFELI